MRGESHQDAPALGTTSSLIVRVVLGLTFAVQAIAVFRRNINWDEFLFLSNIYRAARGETLPLLQTAYVHLFGWLPAIGRNEIDQIMVARAIYVVLLAESLVLLFRLAQRWLDSTGALATVAIFAVFSYSLAHAASFRIDGLLLPLLIGHALLLSEPSPRRLVAAGAVFGIALALSIKTALWAPMTAGFLLWWIWKKETSVSVAAASVAAGLAAFGVCLSIHQWLNAPAAEFAQATRAATALSPIASYMFLEEGLLPRLGVLGGAVVQNFVTAYLMISGALLALFELKSPQQRAKVVPLLLLATPALAIIFYANAWHYAYVTLIPTACLLAGSAVSRIARLGHRVVLVVMLGVSIPLLGSTRELLTDGIEPQREVLSTVHALFPEPVPYIDYTGMISSFPRGVFLMTRLGRRGYLERGVPLVANYIAGSHPPLLIVNLPALDVRDGGLAERIEPDQRLLPADADALRRTYVPYWGAIYLAGQEWRGLDRGHPAGFEMAIPGDYTLISEGPVLIDGQIRDSGATIMLGPGQHTIETGTRLDRVRLLWGKNVTIPSASPSPLPIYVPL